MGEHAARGEGAQTRARRGPGRFSGPGGEALHGFRRSFSPLPCRSAFCPGRAFPRRRRDLGITTAYRPWYSGRTSGLG